jgi:glyoxylase-like metal-dependent hydrolase (beta-lactamase superfamily II)
MKYAIAGVALAVLIALGVVIHAETIAPPVKSLRVYVFDCGLIHGENPIDYGLHQGEVKNSDMVVPCYLIVHPKGTLIWDVGVIPDSAFRGDGPVTQSDGSETVSSPRPLLPQLAALGYPADSITYIAFSHYHFDHTANANAFAASTWLVHRTEREAMFAAKPEDQARYSRLRASKTVLLPDTDYDVFGDGTVVIKYATGHTPGHQVLALKLPRTGSVLIAGDLWHYTAERGAARAPVDEANPQGTLASRAAIEAYLKRSGAQLWIQHDPETWRRLRKAPDYIQ